MNLSVNETLSRTVMTSFTTLLALIALLVLGGDVIRGFVFAMIWGVVVGTYSSVFVALDPRLVSASSATGRSPSQPGQPLRPYRRLASPERETGGRHATERSRFHRRPAHRRLWAGLLSRRRRGASRARCWSCPRGVFAWGGFEDTAPLLATVEISIVLFVGTGAEIAHIPPRLRSGSKKRVWAWRRWHRRRLPHLQRAAVRRPACRRRAPAGLSSAADMPSCTVDRDLVSAPRGGVAGAGGGLRSRLRAGPGAVCCAGRTAAGKTTLLRTLAGSAAAAGGRDVAGRRSRWPMPPMPTG